MTCSGSAAANFHLAGMVADRSASAGTTTASLRGEMEIAWERELWEREKSKKGDTRGGVCPCLFKAAR